MVTNKRTKSSNSNNKLQVNKPVYYKDAIDTFYTNLNFNVKDIKDVNTFENLLKQYDRCIDIDRSLIYMHSDIEYGSLFDLMNNVTLILKCRDKSLNQEPINISLNSPGGDIYEMFGIMDFIQSLPVKVNINVRGIAMSAAALILATTTGERTATVNSSIMLHELSTETGGKMSDVKSSTLHLENIELNSNILLANVTNQPIEFWENKLKKDFYLTPEQALGYGLIDKIVI